MVCQDLVCIFCNSTYLCETIMYQENVGLCHVVILSEAHTESRVLIFSLNEALSCIPTINLNRTDEYSHNNTRLTS